MQLEKRLEQIALLSDLSAEEIKQVIALSSRQQFSADCLVFKEGELAHAMYVVLDGSADVIKAGKNGRNEILATLEEDDLFGEQGFINDLRRTHSVKAHSHLTILEINYDVLRHITKRVASFTKKIEKQALGKSIANLQMQLDSIDSYVKRELFTLPDQTSLKHFKSGDIIFNVGQSSDCVYFISSGAITLEFPQTLNHALLTISEGEILGEVGVINNKPRAATARAKTAVSLISIPGQIFLNAFHHTIGLKKIIRAHEIIYALPLHQYIYEQYISHLQDESVICVKYRLPSKAVAVLASSIEHPVLSLHILGKVADQVRRFEVNSSKYLELSISGQQLIGLKAIGDWPFLHRLSMLLLQENRLANVTEEYFRSLVSS